MAGYEAIFTGRGIVELLFRVACLILSVCSIISASVYFGVLTQLCNSIAAIQRNNPQVVVGSCANFSYSIEIQFGSATGSVITDLYGSVGWVLALSVVVIACQIFAILQIFLGIEVFNKKAVICKKIWTIYSFLDLIVLGVVAFGFFCGGVATALLAEGTWSYIPQFYQKAANQDQNLQNGKIYTNTAKTISNSIIFDTCVAVSVFPFVLTLVCVGMIIYFLIAKFVLKWPTHGAENLYEEEILP